MGEKENNHKFIHMKATCIQRFFAQKWVWPILCLGLPTFIGLLYASKRYPDEQSFTKAVLGGACFGVFLAYVILYTVFHCLARFNGAPFNVGDKVRILCGEHSGKIVTVYEEWYERNQVRVDLGMKAKMDCEDVFSYIELCKE